MFAARRSQEPGRKKGIPLYMCFIDLIAAYESVDQTLPLAVLSRFGLPPRMNAVNRQFHDGIQACVRLDDGECLDMFDLEQCRRRGCTLAPLLSNMILTAALRVTKKRFLADEVIMDGMVQIQRKKEKGEKTDRPRVAKPTGRLEEQEAQNIAGNTVR